MENWLPTQFQIDLFDVVDVTSVQLKVSALKFEIVGMTERVNRAPDNLAVHFVTVYQLQEQKVHAMFFTTDVSHLDGADLLAY